jgi:hypothetical protein
MSFGEHCTPPREPLSGIDVPVIVRATDLGYVDSPVFFRGDQEQSAGAYLVRLAAFALIIIAVTMKNRGGQR